MALGLGLRPRGLELALSIPLPPSFSGPAPALSGTAAAPMSKVLPGGRGECGFRSPKSFLGVNFFEGLPPSGPKNKGAGQKFQGFGHNGGGFTGMVHTILVEPTKWWLLTICKQLMICRCRQNIPTAIWLRSTKSGRSILPRAAKWWQFTECLHLQALKLPFGAKDVPLCPAFCGIISTVDL